MAEVKTPATYDSGFGSLSQCATDADLVNTSDGLAEYGWVLRTSITGTNDDESNWYANMCPKQTCAEKVCILEDRCCKLHLIFVT